MKFNKFHKMVLMNSKINLFFKNSRSNKINKLLSNDNKKKKKLKNKQKKIFSQD